MNVYDSDRMERLLAGEGCLPVKNARDAKLIIVNTCTIREKARHKVLSLLGTLRELKQEDPDRIFVVAGCVAQQEGKGLLAMVPYLDIVMGPDQVDSLPNLVRRAKEKDRISATDFSDEEQLSLQPLLPVKGKQNLASAFVTIATGCDKKCSFCIVPYVRGEEKCRAPEELLDEIKSLLSIGVKEIVLVGQTVNAYRYGKTSFAELLKRVNDLPGLKRLRYLTSHPADMTDEILNCFGQLENLCESLHLPVQSGSNSVLKRMIRRYKREEYIEIIQKLRGQLPGVSITTDIIVGFPGESDEEFEETMSLLKEVRFDGSYSFLYSPRPNLPSTRIPDEVPTSVKNNRLHEYQSIQNEIIDQYNQAYLGKTLEVLIEGPSKSNPKVMTGRTRTNRLVHVPGNDSMIGELTQVKITHALTSYLRGGRVENGLTSIVNRDK